MKNAVRCTVLYCTVKVIWHFGRQMSYLSVQPKLDSFFRPASLHATSGRASEASVGESIKCILL
jgi:hypothetical protein